MTINPDDPASYERAWSETRSEFSFALRQPGNFPAFSWTVRLLGHALFHYGYYRTGLFRLGIHARWRSWIPFVGLLLVVLVAISYFSVLRSVIVGGGEGGMGNFSVHDAVVSYFVTMILFHYVSGCFRSPGVVLPAGGGSGGDGIEGAEVVAEGGHLGHASSEREEGVAIHSKHRQP